MNRFVQCRLLCSRWHKYCRRLRVKGDKLIALLDCFAVHAREHAKQTESRVDQKMFPPNPRVSLRNKFLFRPKQLWLKCSCQGLSGKSNWEPGETATRPGHRFQRRQ